MRSNLFFLAALAPFFLFAQAEKTLELTVSPDLVFHADFSKTSAHGSVALAGGGRVGLHAARFFSSSFAVKMGGSVGKFRFSQLGELPVVVERTFAEAAVAARFYYKTGHCQAFLEGGPSHFFYLKNGSAVGDLSGSWAVNFGMGVDFPLGERGVFFAKPAFRWSLKEIYARPSSGQLFSAGLEMGVRRRIF